MIRVVHDTEPAALVDAREAGLSRTRALIAAGQPTAEALSGYQIVRSDLRRQQHGKCVWCELWQGERHEDVEHFRPKSMYWWLTWTWDNLFFSCAECNRSWKGDRFDLAGGVRLVAERQPPGRERPLLLDPARDDPAQHIQFRLVGGRWLPTPRGGSLRGDHTIRQLGLDRSVLLDFYSEHVETLTDAIASVRAALQSQDAAEILRVWNRAIRSRLRASAPLTALTRDVFDHHFPPRVRDRWGLDLPAF